MTIKIPIMAFAEVWHTTPKEKRMELYEALVKDIKGLVPEKVDLTWKGFGCVDPTPEGLIESVREHDFIHGRNKALDEVNKALFGET